MFDDYPFTVKPIYLIILGAIVVFGVGGYYLGQSKGYNTAKAEASSKSALNPHYSVLVDGNVSGTTFETATQLRIGYETQGALKTGTNIDTYYFQLDTNADVKTNLSNVPHEYNTFVYDWKKKLIASTLRSGYKESSATIGSLPPGKYYIQVVTKYDEPVDYPYTIRVDILPVTE